MQWILALSLSVLSLSSLHAQPAAALASGASDRQKKMDNFAGDAPQYYVGWALESVTGAGGKVSDQKTVVTVGVRRYSKDRVVSDTQYYLKDDGSVDTYQYRFRLMNSLATPKWEMSVYGEDRQKSIARGKFELGQELSEGQTLIVCKYNYDAPEYIAEGTDKMAPSNLQKVYKELYSEQSTSTEKTTSKVSAWKATYYRISEQDFQKLISFDAAGKSPKIAPAELARLKKLILE